MKGIYAIRDTLAQALVGGLFLHSHSASAVRFFSDVASDAQTLVSRHIDDHELVFLGTLDEETGAIVSDAPAVVITGAAWKASQSSELELTK